MSLEESERYSSTVNGWHAECPMPEADKQAAEVITPPWVTEVSSLYSAESSKAQ